MSPSSQDSNTSGHPAAATLLAFAAWHILTCTWGILAALSSFQRLSSAALTFGALALASMLTALSLKQASVRWGKPVPAQLLSVAGLAFQVAVFGFVAHFSSQKTQVLSLPFGAQLLREGIVPAALCVSGSLIALFAFWTWQWSHARFTMSVSRLSSWVLVVGVLSVIVGPSFELRADEPARAWTKRSVQDVLKAPWGQQLRLVVWQTDDVDDAGQKKLISCVGYRARNWLVLNIATNAMLPASATPSDLALRLAHCQRESDEALANGEAIEAPLLRGDAASYLHRLPNDHIHEPIGLPLARLPDALRSPLKRWVPVSDSLAPTAYDLAIAIQQTDLVKRHIPVARELQPHHRQALFKLGHSKWIDDLPGETPESREHQHQHRRTAQALYGAAQSLGNAGMSQTTPLYSILGSLTSEPAHTGRFSAVDYFFANRHCDLPYAKYLKSRQLLPDVAHAKHLLSLLARVQHGEHNLFPFADESLGEPTEAELPGCVELAEWYGEQVRFKSHEDFKVTYNHLIGVSQVRSAQVRVTFSRPPRSTADLTAKAVAALVAHQSPSMANVCAWVNTSTWSLVDPEEDTPEVRTAILRVAGQLKGKKWEFLPIAQDSPASSQDRRSACVLEQIGYASDPVATLKRLNRRLAELELPCFGQQQRDANAASLPLLHCSGS